MKGFSISFTLGKASSVHGGNVDHNNRDFIAKNVDPTKTDNNILYKAQDIETAYHELFDAAVAEYNSKKSRPSRRINDYYEHIKNGRREETYYETIVQFGSVQDAPCGSERGEVAKKMLDDYMKGFQKRNPNLHVFNAILHMDEASPHIHIDFIPFYTQGRTNGLSKGVSMKAALIEQGYKSNGKMTNHLIEWENSERKVMETIINSYGYEREEMNAKYKHLSVEDYKIKQDENTIRTSLKRNHYVSSDDISQEKMRSLMFKLSSADKKIAALEKEKSSPNKSFFYSNPDKQAFIQSKMDAANIPYVETENGFDAQECYVKQIREWEKIFKPSSKSFREQLIDEIDKLLMRCSDVDELYKKLEADGFAVKLGRYISVRPPKAERFIRLKSLGEEYNERALQNRIQQSHKFEVKLNENIDKAEADNLPSLKILKTMRFYTVTFKKGLLPCHKKHKQLPFSWLNDEELDRLLLLNRKINAGETIESMKKEFELKELELKEKNAAAEEALKRYQRLARAEEAFLVLYEGKESSFISIKQAEQYREAYPNITESNYVEVFKFTEQAKSDSDAAKSIVQEAEQELRSLGGAIAIAAKVQAGTYVQELVCTENIHRNADILPNGVFQL
ncbi:plasmid recombination protein [Ruminococcus flavefaciens]|uniref:Plasmid recombination enzyme n=1 Tax=Ruminococcus flavefaciens TaxID=1265 RepID=A0A1M7MGT5_RUMFL|nr:plasmid recombination protein [Ruminococcus flavefaciens]SHM90013.1 Plasmid recombination enzyme [Ruminococcus flavefaciens]